jgi:opacity protein-like surface antigen
LAAFIGSTPLPAFAQSPSRSWSGAYIGAALGGAVVTANGRRASVAGFVPESERVPSLGVPVAAGSFAIPAPAAFGFGMGSRLAITGGIAMGYLVPVGDQFVAGLELGTRFSPGLIASWSAQAIPAPLVRNCFAIHSTCTQTLTTTESLTVRYRSDLDLMARLRLGYVVSERLLVSLYFGASVAPVVQRTGQTSTGSDSRFTCGGFIVPPCPGPFVSPVSSGLSRERLQWRLGPAVGLSVDYKLTENWIFRMEAVSIFYGRISATPADTLNGTTTSKATTVLAKHFLQLGFAYRF